MLKVSWSIEHDKFSYYFAICDHKSAWQLWWTLTQGTTAGSHKPINVRVTGLDGEEVGVNGGMVAWIRAAELTREAN